MLRSETVEPGTLALLRELMQDKTLDDLILIGGAALSLQIGHRMSIDIDLFSQSPFDPTTIARHLVKRYGAYDIQAVDFGIFCYIRDVKVDIIRYDASFVKPLIIEDLIRMASLEDIGAMKLSAMVKSGAWKKDFVDMHFLLEQRPLSAYTAAYTAKYLNVNEAMAHTALISHDKIMPLPIDFLHREVTLTEMLERSMAAIREPDKVFSPEGAYKN